MCVVISTEMLKSKCENAVLKLEMTELTLSTLLTLLTGKFVQIPS